ncbi:MAG: helix-turn-helix transcriptional regulator [Clostridiales bacterium]|nr:helix-turn-helix transcriptional regulator [Clostridiales bacterium]
MTLGDKLAKLRKDNNYTQEQLAEILDVTRQSVSRWESDIAIPETDKLIKLGELYNCSMDYLLKDDVEEEQQHASFSLKNFYYERKSSKTVHGIPLWHINIGLGRSAKGIIAIGLCARGLISVGFVSLGLLSFGLLSLGLVSLGVVALGLIAAGTISAGVIAVGAISCGLLAIGSVAIGEFSVGALAVGNYFAMGDHAYAAIAIGKTKAVGTLFQANAVNSTNRPEIITLLKENVPKIFSWITELIKPLLKVGG